MLLIIKHMKYKIIMTLFFPSTPSLENNRGEIFTVGGWQLEYVYIFLKLRHLYLFCLFACLFILAQCYRIMREKDRAEELWTRYQEAWVLASCIASCSPFYLVLHGSSEPIIHPLPMYPLPCTLPRKVSVSQWVLLSMCFWFTAFHPWT